MTINPFQDYLDKVQALIRQHGFTVQAVQSNPSFAYTVGLSTPRPAQRVVVLHDDGLDEVSQTQPLPELAVVGLRAEASIALLNTAARQLIAGELTLDSAMRYPGIVRNFPVRFVPLDPVHVGRHFKVVNALNAGLQPYSAWQMLLPDHSGLFPDERGVDPNFAAAQNIALLGSEGLGPQH